MHVGSHSKIYRERKLRLIYRKIIIIVVFAMFVYGAFVLVTYLLSWKPNSTSIEGAYTIEPLSVINDIQSKRFLGLIRLNNKILFPERYARKILMTKFPRIREVEIEKHWDSITYKIIERSPDSLACVQTSPTLIFTLKECWYIDSSGVLFGIAPIFSPGIYTIFLIDSSPTNIPETLLPNKINNTFDKFIDELKFVGIHPTMVRYDGADIKIFVDKIFNLKTPLAGYIIFDTSEVTRESGYNEIIERIKLLMTKGPFHIELEESPFDFQYLDMRFADKVYFKFMRD